MTYNLTAGYQFMAGNFFKSFGHSARGFAAPGYENPPF